MLLFLELTMWFTHLFCRKKYQKEQILLFTIQITHERTHSLYNKF